MSGSLNDLELFEAQKAKKEEIEMLRLEYPQLVQVEADLVLELGKFISSISLSDGLSKVSSETDEAIEAAIRRINALRAKRQGVLTSLHLADDYAKPLYRCPICNDLMAVRVGNSWQTCVCQKQRLMEQLLAKSGITKRMREQTFASFSLEVYSNVLRNDEKESRFQRAEKLVETCKQFILEVSEDRADYGLYIFGNPGVGKTHLIAAMANALIEMEVEIRYLVTSSLLDSLRATHDAPASENKISESAIIDDLGSAQLLFLDDIGVERYTAWALEKLYQIINQRYLHKLPTVFTSNLPINNLEEHIGIGGTATRITSRIVECSRIYLLDGDDLRFAMR